MRVADYVANTLFEFGISDVFLVTGGGAMHLNDAIGRQVGFQVTCCHHEQACAMAAESYFRLSGRLALVNVTSGPGGTNAITGVYGAFVDSLGMLVISGQVKAETMVISTDLPLRQLGDQELDIVPIVRGITKYAVVVLEPGTIRYHLERALYLAVSGRPGPVWLDIPLNVQAADIDPSTLPGYDPREDDVGLPANDVRENCQAICDLVAHAKRPVLMVGTGVRIADQRENLLALATAWGIPLVTAWNAHDTVPDDHRCFAGRPGSLGTRAGNFVVQNADVLIVLGCRLNVRQISYAWKLFARHARIIMVDIDEAELRKPTLNLYKGVHADLRFVIPELKRLISQGLVTDHAPWLEWCRSRLLRYPACLPEQRMQDGPMNPYAFMEALFNSLEEDDVVVTGDGTACVVSFQVARMRLGQRLYTNSGCAAMGYDLPAAVGASRANGGKRIICLAGDGSIQMNLQELNTIIGYGLDIKIIVLNNQGYHSIRQTQKAYFPDCKIGFDAGSGVHIVPFRGISAAFGLPYHAIGCGGEAAIGITGFLRTKGPAMCEVMLDPNQAFSPRVSSRRLADGTMMSAPLEDMAPFLPRGEFISNMLVPPIDG